MNWVKENNEFAALRLKTYRYLVDDDGENEKSKRHKKGGNKTKS